MNIHDTKITVMRGVENTLSLFYNDVSNFFWNKMIIAHKSIYKLFGSGIYHKPHSIFKSKWHEFHNSNIVLFSGNTISMFGYFIGMHRAMCMRKSLLATVSSAQFNSTSLNSKLSKVVSYIQDNKSWERI